MTRNESIQCSDFIVSLAEALDGLAGEGPIEAMRAHASLCVDCRTLHELAREGKNWLGTLDDVEPPVRLVHNILAATSRAESPAPRPVPAVPAASRAWWPALGARLLRPRLVMTAAMAFFSMSLLANQTGVSLADFHVSDLRELRPSRITTRLSMQYYATTARVVRYYENNRFVHELETRLRDLRENAVAEPDEAPPPDDRRPGGRSGVPQEIQVNG